MKTTIKISILIVAFASAVFGLYYYKKTQVDPPTDIQPKNCHYDSAIVEARKIYSDNSNTTIDVRFYKLCDNANLLSKENFISSKQRGEIILEAANGYIDLFDDKCKEIFEQSVWRSHDIRWIIRKVQEVNGLKYHPSYKLSEEKLKKLNSNTAVLDLYNDALKDVKDTKFIDIYDSRKRINRIENYIIGTYLKYNRSLSSRVDNFPKELCNSHQKHIEKSVDSLSWYYKTNDSTQYDNFLQNVNLGIIELRNNAKDVYGIDVDLTDIIAKGRSYVDDSRKYYVEQKRKLEEQKRNNR